MPSGVPAYREAEDCRGTVERNGGRTEWHTCTVSGGLGLGEWVADPEECPVCAGATPPP